MRSFIFTRRYCPISSYEPITDSDTALILYLGREVLDSRTFDNRFKRQQLQLQPKKDGIPKTTLGDQLKKGMRWYHFQRRMRSRLQELSSRLQEMHS
jgi:hypothetical protein